jgi:hypothetical protein
MDEIRAHLLAENGPVDAARVWLEALLTGGDLVAIWNACDPEFRLYLAHSWLWANRMHPNLRSIDHAATATSLAADGPGHELWEVFSEAQLNPLRGAWPWIDLENLGVATRPRPVALGYEKVILAPTLPGTVGYVLSEDTVLDPALRMLMHHVDGRWLVASLGDEKPLVWTPPPD